MNAGRGVFVGLVLLLASGSTPPEPGGRVTILVPDSEEGIAIAAVLGDRAANTYLTRPDGTDSRLSVDSGLAPGAWPRRSWTLVFADAESPNAVDVAGRLQTLLDAADRDGPMGAAWEGLTRARALDDRHLVLTFDRAVCAPLDRFARWPYRAADRGAFRLNSGSGDFTRNDHALWAPRLDRLEIVLAQPPIARPRRSEIAVLPGRAGDSGDPLYAGELGQRGVAVVYSIEVDGSLPDAERRWLERVLAPSAFAPLVAPHEAISLPACARREPEPGAATSITAGHITVNAPGGERPDLLRRRADVVLTERLRDRPERPGTSGNGTGSTIAITIRRDVVLDAGPISMADACGASAPATRWPILAVAYHVDRGSAVIGSIAAPDRLWLAR